MQEPITTSLAMKIDMGQVRCARDTKGIKGKGETRTKGRSEIREVKEEGTTRRSLTPDQVEKEDRFVDRQ